MVGPELAEPAGVGELPFELVGAGQFGGWQGVWKPVCPGRGLVVDPGSGAVGLETGLWLVQAGSGAGPQVAARAVGVR